MQQSASFGTNEFAFLKFMLPEFTEMSTTSFPIHVDAKTNHHSQPCDVVSGLDAMIELGITVDWKNKTINYLLNNQVLQEQSRIGTCHCQWQVPIHKSSWSDKLDWLFIYDHMISFCNQMYNKFVMFFRIWFCFVSTYIPTYLGIKNAILRNTICVLQVMCSSMRSSLRFL